MTLPVLLFLLAGTAQTTPPALITTEFRVFDGPAEVTPAASLRLWLAGRRDAEPLVPREAVIALSPGIYDVEARHVGNAGVVSVKWAERLAIMYYPDEGGRHLQVINVRSDFGALQLRALRGQLDPRNVTLFTADDHSAPAGRALTGDGYLLFVVPAGRYDIRIEHISPDQPPDVHWLIGLDIAADATRLKLVEGSGG